MDIDIDARYPLRMCNVVLPSYTNSVSLASDSYVLLITVNSHQSLTATSFLDGLFHAWLGVALGECPQAGLSQQLPFLSRRIESVFLVLREAIDRRGRQHTTSIPHRKTLQKVKRNHCGTFADEPSPQMLH
jgi:hypothetical protein